MEIKRAILSKLNKEQIKKTILEILKVAFIITLINIMQQVICETGTVLRFYDSISGQSDKSLIEAVFNIFDSNFWLSEIIIFSVYELIKGIINRKKISLIITTVIFYMLEVVNYVVTYIRGISITISDIYSIGTAMNVANGISVEFDQYFTIGLILFVTVILIECLIYRKKEEEKLVTKKNIRIRNLCSITVSIFIVSMLLNSTYIRNIPIWNINDTYTDYGTNLTWVRMITDMNVAKPDNYNKKQVEELLAKYETKTQNELEIDTNELVETDEEIKNGVNIIVVMNESFADFTQNEIINMKQDNIPYFHSLQNEDNVITGTMHSSYYGGGTANVEYEFLTQNSTMILPVGATPYQQYIQSRVNSIISRMNELNYTTVGIHTWYKNGYSRSKIYQLLGFNYSMFKEDYEDLEYGENGYTTDESTYSKIYEALEAKQEDEKIFLFAITMQNHLPYISEIESEEQYTDYEAANRYLQLENRSDIALQKLINYLSNYEEDVVLLFFGDHQPSVNISELEDDYENKYKVPYLIWANYDIEEKEYGDVSTNYLQSILLDTAGIEKDAYTNYMEELRSQIPVITKEYYIAKDGNRYNIQDKESPYYEKIEEYKKIVYYQMFDNN